MWPFGKQSARRREIRRARTEQRVPLHQRLLARVGPWPIGIAAAFGLGTAAILIAGGDEFPYRLGATTRTGITARLAFEIEDLPLTQLRRTQARDGAPSYYVSDQPLLDEIRGRLLSAIKLVKTHAGAPDELRAEAAKINLPLSDEALAELQRLAAPTESSEFESLVDRCIAALVTQPLVETSELAGRRTPLRAVLVHESRQRTVPVAELLYATGEGLEQTVQTVSAAGASAFPPALRSAFAALLAGALRAPGPDAALRPIYRFDGERTRHAERLAEAGVPVQTHRFDRNALLADVGVIDANELNLLRHEHAAYGRLVEGRPELLRAQRLAMLGRAALAFMVAAGAAVYLGIDRRRPTGESARLAGVALVVLAMLGLARFAFVATGLPPLVACGAQAFAAALLIIVYARRFAFGAAGALALLITMAAHQDAGFLVVLLAVSAVMIIGLRDIRSRGKIVLVGFLAGLAAFVAGLADGLVGVQTPRYILWQSTWAAGATLAAAFVVEGVLPFIERLFRLSSHVTLLEWCDASKPLLRLLAAKAPGTYNHSLLMGSMAEAAAEAIGANGLLARAGAYYHDIGKINKPHYFVENAAPGISRHENLSPAMSLLIIIGHVKDGIEMAREYNLPAALRPFIAEHHGTTLVEYFYHAANKRRRPDDPEVADTHFRYPGPKPQTRESAIVMLCDGVEGAVRAMSDPTPARIEAVVNEIARKRLLGGQFDECDLNFRELATIEESLVKSLCGIYHGRIAYPSPEEKSA